MAIFSMASTHARGGTEGAFDSGITVTRRRDRPSAHDEDSADVAPRSEPAASDDEGDATAPAATEASNIISTTPGPRKIRPMLLSDCPVTPNSAAAAAKGFSELTRGPRTARRLFLLFAFCFSIETQNRITRRTGSPAENRITAEPDHQPNRIIRRTGSPGRQPDHQVGTANRIMGRTGS